MYSSDLVYNEASMPPWSLPAAATQMGFMSRSKNGTPDNANALRFDDKSGEEQLWMQAERNMDTRIKNDETHSVGGNHTLCVEKSFESKVSGQYAQQTQYARSELVGSDYILQSNSNIMLAASSGITFVTGDSMLNMNPNGTISLQCKNFQINASGQGEINTGGILDLNINQPVPITPPSPTPADIATEVSKVFITKDAGSSL